jgi:hypothetical protein
LRTADRRLDPRAAQSIHRQGRHLDRHAGLERYVTRAVDRVAARLQHVAHNRVINPLWLDAGFRERAFCRNRAEFER